MRKQNWNKLKLVSKSSEMFCNACVSRDCGMPLWLKEFRSVPAVNPGDFIQSQAFTRLTGFQRIAQGDERNRGHIKGQSQQFLDFLRPYPADPAGTQALFLGLQHQMFPGNAQVQQMIIDAGEQRRQKVGDHRLFRAENNDYRSLFRPRHGDAGQKTFPADALPEFPVFDGDEPPRLLIAGRRRPAGRFQAAFEHIIGNRFRLIAAAARAAFNYLQLSNHSFMEYRWCYPGTVERGYG